MALSRGPGSAQRPPMGDLSVAVTGQKAESAIILTAQLTASGILGVRGAAALSPVMVVGRGEPGCVRGQQ